MTDFTELFWPFIDGIRAFGALGASGAFRGSFDPHGSFTIQPCVFSSDALEDEVLTFDTLIELLHYAIQCSDDHPRHADICRAFDTLRDHIELAKVQQEMDNCSF